MHVERMHNKHFLSDKVLREKVMKSKATPYPYK